MSRIPSLAPARLTPCVVWSLLAETFFEWYEDRAPRLAKLLIEKEVVGRDDLVALLTSTGAPR